MIIEYHRPDSLPQAMELLTRTGVDTVPLGGGTVLNRPSPKPLAVVDLQSLGLNRIRQKGRQIIIGAAATLQALLDAPEIPAGLKDALRREGTHNLRQTATAAGTLVAAGGRSPFAVVMLALGAQLTVQPDEQSVPLGDYLPLRGKQDFGVLITEIAVPAQAEVTYRYIARTPADFPLVSVAAARWPSGRTRVALGGYGDAPLLAFDGPSPDGAEIAARDAYSEAADPWASAEYRSEMAAVLTRRALE